MPYRDERWKGTKEGIETFKIIKREYPNAKLVMFGKKIDNLNFGGLENEVEYHSSPVKGDLRRLYNSCDIFLFFGRRIRYTADGSNGLRHSGRCDQCRRHSGIRN